MIKKVLELFNHTIGYAGKYFSFSLAT